MLKHLDYISTVSGGGYIGSWLCSWIQRKQSTPIHGRGQTEPDPCQNSVAKHQFEAVVSGLAAKTADEPVEITFLRMYSNYLTPRMSFFNADTWVVGAIWARNTLLNLAILIALFASIVLVVHGAGLFGFQHVWPDQNAEWGGALALCGGLLVPIVILIGWNLWRNSTIALQSTPPANRKGECRDKLVIWFCLFPLTSAIAYSFWLARARDVFVNDTLWHGVRANFFVLWAAFLFVQLCTRVYDCHLAKQKELLGGRMRRIELGMNPYFGALLPYVFAPAGAAFVTTALLRAVFNGIANAIRKCRTDFGVNIDLPVAPLRKSNGSSSAHCVVGKMQYPNSTDEGYLLYLKATLTGE